MAVAKCSNQAKKISFTLPIYNMDKTKAVVCMQFICGKDCAETILLLLEFNIK